MRVLSLQESTRVVNMCVCVMVCGVDIHQCAGSNSSVEDPTAAVTVVHVLSTDAWLHKVLINLSVGSDMLFLGAQQLTDRSMPGPWRL